jgi:hypothetical protein
VRRTEYLGVGPSLVGPVPRVLAPGEVVRAGLDAVVVDGRPALGRLAELLPARPAGRGQDAADVVPENGERAFPSP